MKFYLQVNQENIITDAITYPYGNYIEHETDDLPIGINGGWFKFENGQIVEYPELKPVTKDEEIENLKEETSTLGMQLVEKDLQVMDLKNENEMLGQQIVDMDIRLMMGGL